MFKCTLKTTTLQKLIKMFVQSLLFLILHWGLKHQKGTRDFLFQFVYVNVTPNIDFGV